MKIYYAESGVLASYCEYFSALFTFHRVWKTKPGKTRDSLDISFPRQAYMNEEDCCSIFGALSKSTKRSELRRHLANISVEALVFFSSYFGCLSILDFIEFQITENPLYAVPAYRYLVDIYGKSDKFTLKISEFLRDFTNASQNIIDNCILLKSEYRRLLRIVRSRAKTDRFYLQKNAKIILCIACGQRIYLNHPCTYVNLKCCNSLVHRSPCYLGMTSCKYCLSQWRECKLVVGKGKLCTWYKKKNVRRHIHAYRRLKSTKKW